jgi:hypothetical protein
MSKIPAKPTPTTTALATKDDKQKVTIAALRDVSALVGLDTDKPVEAAQVLARRRAFRLLATTTGGSFGGAAVAMGPAATLLAAIATGVSHLLAICGVGSRGGVGGTIIDTSNGVAPGIAGAATCNAITKARTEGV